MCVVSSLRLLQVSLALQTPCLLWLDPGDLWFQFSQPLENGHSLLPAREARDISGFAHSCLEICENNSSGFLWALHVHQCWQKAEGTPPYPA